MKTKGFLSLCLAALITLACCGCSQQPETAAQWVEAMEAALDKTPCTHAQLVMDMAMTLEAPEAGSLTMSTRTTNDVRVSQEPASGCTTATVEVDYGGETSRTVTENYTVMEDGALVSYIHSGGVWMKLSTGQTPEGLAQAASVVSVAADAAAMDETVTTFEGREAVCLTAQVTGEAMEEALGALVESLRQQSGASADEAAAVDYSALTCDMRIYVDKKTCLPMAQEMTFSGMSEALSPLYGALDMTVAVTACTATATFLSCEAQEAITLPEGAAEKAEAWERLLAGEPDNGDGTFTIREGTALVDIVPPEGFQLTDKAYDHLYFKRDDNREVRYTMHHGYATDFTAGLDQQLTRYGSLPRSVSRQQLSLEGDTLHFDADIAGVEWQSYEEGLMYAWAHLGSSDVADYYLFVQVTDGYNDGLGHQKSADITPEEFQTYLNHATPSDLME